MSAVRKIFSLQCHNCPMAQISLISTNIFTKRKKALYCFTFLCFFISRKASFEAALLACISNFADKNAYKMIKTLKMQHLNCPKLKLTRWVPRVSPVIHSHFCM